MADKIGRMDQRISFERSFGTANGLGGFTPTWGEAPAPSSVWAHVQPRGGREGVVADGVKAAQSYLFTIRNRTDITEADRIVWDGYPYNIRRIERQGARAMYLTIEAERGVAD